MVTVNELRQAADPGGKSGTSIDVLREAAKASGERKPPTSIFMGMGEVPESIQPSMQSIMNFFSGFNRQIAKLVSAPVELVDDAMRIAGTNLLESPGNATDAVVRAFETVGIDSTPVEGFAADLGANTLNTILSLGAVYAAAPTLLAQGAAKAPELTTRVGAELGKIVQTHPALVSATEAGATIGATAGEREGGPAGAMAGALAGGAAPAGVVPLTRFGLRHIPTIAFGGVGATTGGILGGPLGAVGGGLIGGKTAIAGRRLAEKAVRRMLGKEQFEEQSILREDISPGTARAAVEDSLDKQVLETQIEIENIFARLPEDPEEASILFRAGLKDALEEARKLESSLYTNKFLAKTTGADPLVIAAKTMRNKIASASPASPTEELDRIANEFTKTVGKKGAKREVGRRVTGLRLQQFGSDLLDAQRAALSGLAPNRRLARNLSILKNAVDNALSQIDPIPVSKAKQTSKKLNDLFFKGPVGRVMRRTRAGELSIPEEQTVQTLLKRPGGFRQISKIASEFSVKELEPLTRQAIRSEFRAAAEQGGKNSTRFLKRHKSAINSFSDELIQLQGEAEKLVKLEARHAAIQKSSLTRFVERDPQVAFQRLYLAKDPAAEANGIITTLDDNPEDVLAFQNEFLVDLFKRGGFSAEKIKAMISQPKTERLVNTVLENDPNRLARLTRVIDIASKLESGALTLEGVRQPVLGVLLDVTGRFTGAGIGRRLGKLTGGATIQQTGAAASFTKNIFLAMTGRLPPELAFSRAILDPKFEALMMTKVPKNSKELIDFRRAVRGFISSKTAIVEGLSKRTKEQEDEDPIVLGTSTIPFDTQQFNIIGDQLVPLSSEEALQQEFPTDIPQFQFKDGDLIPFLED